MSASPPRVVRARAKNPNPFNTRLVQGPLERARIETAPTITPGSVAREGRKALRACRGGSGWSGGPKDPAAGAVSPCPGEIGHKGREQVTRVVQGIGHARGRPSRRGPMYRQGVKSVAGPGASCRGTARPTAPGKPPVRGVRSSSKRYFYLFSGRRPVRPARPSHPFTAEERSGVRLNSAPG